MAKRKSKKIKKIKSDFTIWDFCASIITGTDEVLDEVEEILEDGKEAIWNIAGSAVIGYDKLWRGSSGKPLFCLQGECTTAE